MREKTVENQIKDYLFKHGIYHFKVHGSKFMEPGIADIISCVNGRFIGIEVKRPGAKREQSEQQKIHERNVVKSGGIYILADCLEDVTNIIDPILKGDEE